MDFASRPSVWAAVILLIVTSVCLDFNSATRNGHPSLRMACGMRNCFDHLPQPRRGTRVRAQILLRITSLDPATKFSESCHTVVVNPSGCGIRFSHPLEPGTHV